MKRFIIPLILILSSFAVSAETFTITYQDINEVPRDIDSSYIWFQKLNGGGMFRIAPTITTITGGAEGDYQAVFDPAMMVPGDYLLATWCWDIDSDDYPGTIVYKQVSISDGTSVSINCAGDTGIKRFNLRLQNEDLSDYSGDYYGYWIDPQNRVESVYASGGTSRVTMNTGEHVIQLNNNKSADPTIDVDGIDKTITFPSLSASVHLTLLKDGNPLQYSQAVVYIADNSAPYEYFWIPDTGYVEKNNMFIPGNYIAIGCCVDSTSLSQCILRDEFISQAFSLSPGETKDILLECNTVETVDITTKLASGEGVTSDINVYQYLEDDTKRLLTWLRTDSNGIGSIDLAEGDYGLEASFIGAMTKTGKIHLPPGPVDMTYPETNATINIDVVNAFNGDPIEGATVAVNLINFRENTDSTGHKTVDVYTGEYQVTVTCNYENSATTRDIQTADLPHSEGEGQVIDLEFTCSGSEIRANVINETANGIYPLILTSRQAINSRISLLKDGKLISSGVYFPIKFNVTPGIYDFRVNLYYTAYPQPDPCYYPDPDTGLCNKQYSIIYSGVEAVAGQTAIANIPFQTWVFTDLDSPPTENPFPDTLELDPLVFRELNASDFDPSWIILALALLCLCIASVYKPNNKQD